MNSSPWYIAQFFETRKAYPFHRKQNFQIMNSLFLVMYYLELPGMYVSQNNDSIRPNFN